MEYVTFSGRRPSQLWDELRPFIDLASECRSYVEIGARHGDTFYDVVRHMPAGSLAVAVDLPGGLWGRSSSRVALRRATRALRDLGYDARMILGDSRSPEVIAQVEALGPFEIGLIDGDHTLEGVRADFENYGPMIGIVGFHDIVGTGQSERGGRLVEVPILWDELKQGPRVFREFVAPGSKMGIGVLL